MISCVRLTVDSLHTDRVTPECLGQLLDSLRDNLVEFKNTYSHGVATPFSFPGINVGSHWEGNGDDPESTTTVAERFGGEIVGYSNNGRQRPDRGYDRELPRFEENPNFDGQCGITVIDKIVRILQKMDTLPESEEFPVCKTYTLRGPSPLNA